MSTVEILNKDNTIIIYTDRPGEFIHLLDEGKIIAYIKYIVIDMRSDIIRGTIDTVLPNITPNMSIEIFYRWHDLVFPMRSKWTLHNVKLVEKQFYAENLERTYIPYELV